MLSAALLALACPALAALSPTDSLPTPARAAAADSARARSQHVVRTFSPLLVRASGFDPASTQTVERPPAPPSELPIDDYRQSFRARPGVVLTGEELHVRGGRTGELAYELVDLPLQDPLRGAPLAVPLFAVDEPSLLMGAIEAQHAGALAGTLVLTPAPPPSRPQGRLAWQTDGGRTTHYDRVDARLGAPLGLAGLGVATSLEARLDDTALPALRSQGRHSFLGLGSFGWRADNRLLAHAIVAPAHDPDETRARRDWFALEALAGRLVEQPYDRMFTLDGWVKQLADSAGFQNGPVFSRTQQPGFTRYRAADHVALTDTRQLAWMASWRRALRGSAMLAASAGFVRVDRLTSVGGRTDPAGVSKANGAVFGLADWPTSDPFDVYAGDEPLFRRSRADRLMARGEWSRTTARDGYVRAGVEARADRVRLFEYNGVTYGAFQDSVRRYRAHAPGGAAWIQSRFVFEGMVANLGLRLNYFSPGPEARAQSLGAGAEVRDHWTLGPRLGVAFPVGVRDALSFTYTRIDEDPARDFLYDSRTRVSNLQPVGNPALVPATLASFEVIEKHAFDESTSATSGFFYRDLYGLIGTVWEQEAGFVDRPTYENAGQGHAAGLELSLARVLKLGIHARLAYTLADAVGPTSLEEGVRFGIPVGQRPPAITNAPLDWDVRHALGLELVRVYGRWSLAWTTVVNSGLPWTPHDSLKTDADLSRLNSRRLPWSEETDARVTWTVPRLGGRLRAGLEAHNLFDHRGPVAATVDGYPSRLINTIDDDYGTYRTQTGQGGGAYLNDPDQDGVPQWIPVHDPRLNQPPRTVRLSLDWAF